jgi:hypothetical protein
MALYDPASGLTQLLVMPESQGWGGNGSVVAGPDDPSWYMRRALGWMAAPTIGSEAAVMSFDGHVLDLQFPLRPDEDHIVR